MILEFSCVLTHKLIAEEVNDSESSEQSEDSS